MSKEAKYLSTQHLSDCYISSQLPSDSIPPYAVRLFYSVQERGSRFNLFRLNLLPFCCPFRADNTLRRILPLTSNLCFHIIMDRQRQRRNLYGFYYRIRISDRLIDRQSFLFFRACKFPVQRPGSFHTRDKFCLFIFRSYYLNLF